MNLKQLRLELPRSRPKSLIVNSADEYRKATDELGELITPFIAAKLGQVSRQRIYSLIEQRRFRRIMVHGMVHIAYEEFEEWRKTQRRVGRPRTRTERSPAEFQTTEIGETRPEQVDFECVEGMNTKMTD